jgi:hypothetical protein
MRFSEILGGLGFALIALIGGIVAHIQQYELLKLELTPWQHFWGILRRSVMGGFGGILVYFAWHGAGWPEAYGYFAAGVVGLFSSQAFEFMWSVVKQVIAKRLGVKE